jgi:hypothetical protein
VSELYTTVSFFVLVCLSVRMEQFGYQWTDCSEIQCFIIFLKSFEGIFVGFLGLEDGAGMLFRKVSMELLLPQFYLQ